MARVEMFEDLEIWQRAREICNDVYDLIENTPLGRNYALRDQMDKSSGSVMDNIAEGFERNGNREFIQFLSISKASCGELRSQLYRTFDRGHIDKETFDVLKKKIMVNSKKIGAFMNYLSKSEFRGFKYKNK
ncbi:four helix bundle protein [Allomuricauda sp. SCSIO 65647]|uniref:four helix bundle protein n=1 Tax=Allomuricauda sp. SCSIO 65647 TaxID=2908843 RepID=UPI001F40312B|nr:four helix bundle protein [Muricauda sp. SCSIO 65647]UJH66614.1 four helix bundle protein [Muricauda sp. SCSIO 65647]